MIWESRKLKRNESFLNYFKYWQYCFNWIKKSWMGKFFVFVLAALFHPHPTSLLFWYFSALSTSVLHNFSYSLLYTKNKTKWKGKICTHWCLHICIYFENVSNVTFLIGYIFQKPKWTKHCKTNESIITITSMRTRWNSI